MNKLLPGKNDKCYSLRVEELKSKYELVLIMGPGYWVLGTGSSVLGTGYRAQYQPSTKHQAPSIEHLEPASLKQ